MVFALAYQIPILALSVFINDYGVVSELLLIAFLVFWSATGILLTRRHQTLTAIDTIFIRAGFLPLCLIVSLISTLFLR